MAEKIFNWDKQSMSPEEKKKLKDEQLMNALDEADRWRKEEEYRLIASLGLREEDLIDKDDPDLGSIKSADAILRSQKRQKEYRKKKIEEAKEKRDSSNSYDQMVQTRYRCEQVNATRADDVHLSNTIQKFQFVVSMNLVDHIAHIDMEDHYYQSFPNVIDKIFDLVTVIEKIKNYVTLSWGSDGKIQAILNLEEQQKRWDELKSSSDFEKMEIIRAFKKNNMDAYNDIIVNGDKRFSVENKNAIYEYQATLFYSILFNKYLTNLELDTIITDKVIYASSLFNGLSFPIELSYQTINQTEDSIKLNIKGKAALTDGEKENVKTLYEKFYQPTINYKFTEYIVEYHLICTLDQKTHIVKEANLSINEAVKYNIENLCQFKLRRLEE